MDDELLDDFGNPIGIALPAALLNFPPELVREVIEHLLNAIDVLHFCACSKSTRVTALGRRLSSRLIMADNHAAPGMTVDLSAPCRRTWR